MPVALKLEELTWIEAEEALRHRPVGLLPIGAIEAHGPHLPLDTDIVIARATAERAASLLEAASVPSIILPAISYSVSFAGTSFPGTSPVDSDVFEAYVASVLAHLATQGFRAIICCNAHLEPIHVDALHFACKRAESSTSVPIRSPDQRAPEYSVHLGEEFVAGARHAGSYETSIMLYARPDAVRVDELTHLSPVWIDLPAKLREGARTFLEAGSEFGYFGDPAVATVDEGDRLLEALGNMILQSCREAGVM